MTPKLTPIGQPLRSRARQPGLSTTPLRGSNIAPVYVPAEPRPARAVVITRGPSYTHDPRVQCAPDERPWGMGAAAAGIGRDPATGRGWDR